MAKDEDAYQNVIMKVAEPIIKQSHPDADEFKFISTKEFIEGKLTIIEFSYNDSDGTRKRGTNLIYDHNGTYTYARNADMLLGIIGAIQPHTVDIVLRPTNVAGMLALVLLLLVGVLLLMKTAVPSELWSGFTLILGFYFGFAKRPNGEQQTPT
jgi:hypothetical protein